MQMYPNSAESQLSQRPQEELASMLRKHPDGVELTHPGRIDLKPDNSTTVLKIAAIRDCSSTSCCCCVKENRRLNKQQERRELKITDRLCGYVV